MSQAVSPAIENINQAMQRAMAVRPKVGGFPYLAQALREAGVRRNVWQLPSCQSAYETELGPVVMQGQPLVSGMVDVPVYDETALIQALRTDQNGESTFPEFLEAVWRAGVVSYDVDLQARTCTYFGAASQSYVESYPAVSLG